MTYFPSQAVRAMSLPATKMLVLNRRQTRLVDQQAIRELGMSGLVLMENAGRGVVDVLLGLGVTGPVAIACGKGNNAGDGLVIARHLENHGIAVRTLLWARPTELADDARTNYEILRRAGSRVELIDNAAQPADVLAALKNADWIVDALLGTGATGAPRPPLDAVLAALNGAPAKKLAVDLPSGFDCDSGAAAAPTFRADHTCTFVAHKPGFLAPGASQYTGQVHVIDIGVPRSLIEQIASER